MKHLQICVLNCIIKKEIPQFCLDNLSYFDTEAALISNPGSDKEFLNTFHVYHNFVVSKKLGSTSQSRLPLTIVRIVQLCFVITKTLVHLTFTKTAYTSITVMTLFLSFVTIPLVPLVYSLSYCNKTVNLAVRL